MIAKSAKSAKKKHLCVFFLASFAVNALLFLTLN